MIGGNAPQIAKQYNAELDANIRFVSERTKSIPDAQKPLVLHISDGSNLRKIDGGRSIVGDWIRIAGGRTALPDTANLAEVPMEEIVKANPDIVIIGGRNAAQGCGKGFDGLSEHFGFPLLGWWMGFSDGLCRRVRCVPQGTHAVCRCSGTGGSSGMVSACVAVPHTLR